MLIWLLMLLLMVNEVLLGKLLGLVGIRFERFVVEILLRLGELLVQLLVVLLVIEATLVL